MLRLCSGTKPWRNKIGPVKTFVRIFTNYSHLYMEKHVKNVRKLGFWFEFEQDFGYLSWVQIVIWLGFLIRTWLGFWVLELDITCFGSYNIPQIHEMKGLVVVFCNNMMFNKLLNKVMFNINVFSPRILYWIFRDIYCTHNIMIQHHNVLTNAIVMQYLFHLK